MEEKGRELYGLGRSPSNSLVTAFEVAVAVAVMDGVADVDGVVVVVGVWVQ